MFNKFFLIVFSLFFLLSFTSALKVVSPIEAEVLSNSTVELGKISPGQSFELIVFDERFNSIEITGNFEGWGEEQVFYEKNIGIKINVPFDASFGAKKISFNAFNSSTGESEAFDVLINVQEDLWSLNISGLNRTTKVNSPVEYKLIFFNESIGAQEIFLSSDLPSPWMKSKTFSLEPKSILKDSVKVNPKHYGSREFNFIFISLFSGEKKEFNSKLAIESDLFSKYSSPAFGFPFFTPTLFSYYLLEAFAGISVESLLNLN